MRIIKLIALLTIFGLTTIAATAQPAPAPDGSPSATKTKTKTKTADAKPAAGKPSINLPAEKAQPVRISKFEKPPVIDGKLDDDVWKTAASFKDFYQTSP